MTPAEALREKVAVVVFPDDLFGENCYLIRRRDTTAALVVDPGLQVGGVPQVHRETGAPIAMQPDDVAILDWERFAQMPFVPPGFAPFTIDTRLAHDATLSFQDVNIRVLHTPGHTQGSVCFLFGLDCFAGDTLFQRGIGRTDLPGGDTQKIIFSIRNVLYRLPPKTVVYPGHGPSTTIEEEMLLNPFVPSDR